MKYILHAIIMISVLLGINLFLLSDTNAAGDAAKGKEVYTNTCASCHGPTGKGDGVAAAALDPKPRDLSDAAYVSTLSDDHMLSVIAKGGASVGKSPLMPAWEGILKPEDINNVVAYIRADICKCQAQ